jgi:hypothetical protein
MHDHAVRRRDPADAEPHERSPRAPTDHAGPQEQLEVGEDVLGVDPEGFAATAYEVLIEARLHHAHTCAGVDVLERDRDEGSLTGQLLRSFDHGRTRCHGPIPRQENLLDNVDFLASSRSRCELDADGAHHQEPHGHPLPGELSRATIRREGPS